MATATKATKATKKKVYPWHRPAREWINGRQASEILGVSRSYVTRLVENGVLHMRPLEGTNILFSLKEVQALAAKNEEVFK
jgi:excisionase family DNA binding protein